VGPNSCIRFQAISKLERGGGVFAPFRSLHLQFHKGLYTRRVVKGSLFLVQVFLFSSSSFLGCLNYHFLIKKSKLMARNILFPFFLFFWVFLWMKLYSEGINKKSISLWIRGKKKIHKVYKILDGLIYMFSFPSLWYNHCCILHRFYIHCQKCLFFPLRSMLKFVIPRIYYCFCWLKDYFNNINVFRSCLSNSC